MIDNGRWEFNQKVDSEFLSLFFSDHMNESLNVSRYVWYIRDHVRSAAVERGPLERFGAKGPGTSVYFRDPDGSLMEFMSYAGMFR